jgi:hypothetical protein
MIPAPRRGLGVVDRGLAIKRPNDGERRLVARLALLAFEGSSAVSSPQIGAVAVVGVELEIKPPPRTFLPRYPAARASSSARTRTPSDLPWM